MNVAALETTGDFFTRVTVFVVSPQTVCFADSDVPFEKLNWSGTMTIGILLVTEPKEGSVPTMAVWNVVPLKTKDPFQSGI
jgi:hypothetical protein